MGNTVQKLRRNEKRPRELEEESKEDEASTFTCEICIEPMLSSTKKFKNKNRCVHPFCLDCTMKYIQVKVDDNIADVPCPGLNCGQLLDPLSCREILPAKLFDNWCDVLCDSAVQRYERCYCPNRDCSALVVNECGDQNVKKSTCPNCKRLFCFHCKLPWHSGYRCEESGEMRDDNDIQFGVFLETKNWKRCPQCGRCIELFEGCNQVMCRCGTKFCYKCGMKNDVNLCACDRVAVRRCCSICCILFLIIPFVVVISCVGFKPKH